MRIRRAGATARSWRIGLIDRTGSRGASNAAQRGQSPVSAGAFGARFRLRMPTLMPQRARLLRGQHTRCDTRRSEGVGARFSGSSGEWHGSLMCVRLAQHTRGLSICSGSHSNKHNLQHLSGLAACEQARRFKDGGRCFGVANRARRAAEPSPSACGRHQAMFDTPARHVL